MFSYPFLIRFHPCSSVVKLPFLGHVSSTLTTPYDKLNRNRPRNFFLEGNETFFNLVRLSSQLAHLRMHWQILAQSPPRHDQLVAHISKYFDRVPLRIPWAAGLPRVV